MIFGSNIVTNFWPSHLSAKDYDSPTRESIKFHEEIRQLTVRVAALEKKKK